MDRRFAPIPLALIPLILLSACAAQPLNAAPNATVQIEIPVTKPQPYTVTIGTPTSPGQASPLVEMVVGALAAATLVDHASQAGSRHARLTAMVQSEGRNLYVTYATDLQSRLQAYGETVTLVDPAGQALTVLPAPGKAASASPPADTTQVDPPALVIDASQGAMPSPDWVLRLSHVDIGYNAPGVTAYFDPTASATIAVIRAPGHAPHAIHIIATINRSADQFFTFKDILAHPAAAANALAAVTTKLARETAAAIEIHPKTN